MNLKTLKNPLLLLLASVVWGMGFVAQEVGDAVPVFQFNASRSFVASIVLIPVILLLGDKAPKPIIKNGTENKLLLIGGVLCGCALAVASAFQQSGMKAGADPGKAAFITAMYIILVPVFGIFLKKRATLKIWLSVVIAIVGLGLLCLNGSDMSINVGDLLELCCAVVFSIHILIIDHFSPKVECVKMACIQFFVCGVISTLLSVCFRENFDFSVITDNILPILYLGIMSSGVGYTLQIVAQRDTDPTVASIIMSMESVFGVLASTAAVAIGLIGGSFLTLREVLGCVVMFGAIILSQLPERKKLNK